jgi:hypothetical protein
MCFIEKEVTEFSFSKEQGYGSYCKPCQSAYYKAYNASRTAAQPKEIPQSKTCRDCGLEKPISQFGKKSMSLDKHNIYCKPCWRVRVKAAVRRMRNGG